MKTNGITLIALVVTIVVLIILATISINAVLGENGIIKRAESARQHQANAEASDNEALDELDKHLANAMAGEGNGGTTNPPDEKPLTSTVTSTEHIGTEAEDTLGNPVYIPGGFKIAEDSGSTVKEGIVVEDDEGNQFVWIPVSNIDGSENNPIKIDETNEVVITLGRYTFANSSAEVPGAPTIVQKGSEYAETTLEAVTSYRIEDDFCELTDVRESTESSGTDGTNSTAKDLAGFIESVEENHGYYLARYEASYSSGSTFGVGNDETYYKPASKVSTANSDSSMSYTSGTLWNFITQGNASKACRQMYYGNEFVESDLVNSYAWDTAIVYIQAMGNSNYANQRRGSNTSLLNTGSTGDEVCKIFDMAGNCYEWTTEFSTGVGCGSAHPCTIRGGSYNYSYHYASYRSALIATAGYKSDSFRALLYCKTGA